LTTPGHELEKHVAHDKEAFALLYEENYLRIFNYVLSSVTDVETALDLTSETFFKALRALPRYRYTGSPFAAWLMKIASNEIAMFFRKKKRAGGQVEFCAETIEVHEAILADQVRKAAETIEASDEFLALSPFLKELQPKYREVVFLRFFEGLAIDDISRVLGRPPGTVKSQLSRAMKILRAGMQPGSASEHLTGLKDQAFTTESE